MAYRLHKPELLSEWRHTQTVKEIAQMGNRKSEPNSTPVREGGKLLTKARRCEAHWMIVGFQ